MTLCRATRIRTLPKNAVLERKIFKAERIRLLQLKVGTHDGTSPCDLLQGLFAGTTPIVCADLKDNRLLVC